MIDRCHICFCDYADRDQLRMLSCFHDYHVACIDRWLKVPVWTKVYLGLGDGAQVHLLGLDDDDSVSRTTARVPSVGPT